jgi:hypothetical protein
LASSVVYCSDSFNPVARSRKCTVASTSTGMRLIVRGRSDWEDGKQEVAQGKETAKQEFVQATEAVAKETALFQAGDGASLIDEESVGGYQLLTTLDKQQLLLTVVVSAGTKTVAESFRS